MSLGFFFYINGAHRVLHYLTHSFPSRRFTELRSPALRKQVKRVEAGVAALTARRSAIDRAMFDPASAGAEYGAMTMTELMKLRADTERRLDAAEAQWLAAEEALEEWSVAA